MVITQYLAGEQKAYDSFSNEKMTLKTRSDEY